MNFVLGFAVVILLALGLAGYLMPDSLLFQFSARLIWLGLVIGLIVLLVNGTFFNSRLYWIAFAFFLMSVMGAVMKILHLPGADQLLLVADVSIPLIYLIHFLKKDQKVFLDFMKVVAVIAFFGGSLMQILHLFSQEERFYWQVVVNIILFSTIVVFYVKQYSGKDVVG